jgi:alkylhydroperoxidase family enzyme
MAFIPYVPEAELLPAERVPDPDHILQIHTIHPAIMRLHWQLYREVMYGSGPLSRQQRELLAVRVSALNQCHY